MNISITHIDTACMLLDINGYRIMTDPTLDHAGRLYYHGAGAFSRKTGDPAIAMEKLYDIDLVLLSHHQHKDNFDNNGKQLAKRVPLVISTTAAAKAIPGVSGLAVWERRNIDTAKVPGLTITATPAQHRPWWIPEFVSGKVIGFVIEWTGQQHGVVYISGDTVYFKGIEQVARMFNIDIGIFHLGCVEFPYLTGMGRYTMNSDDLMKAAAVLDPRVIIPIHYKGWSHFKEKEQTLRDKIASGKQVRDRTIFLTPGVTTII